ncbi:MAG TPA: hypothetical protein EYP07_04100 [Kiloniellaceae bacterium]|nr:hypothetical protein [Kiloniellaceae bacterium]
MDYEKLKQRALAENDLMNTVDHLINNDDQVYYADRHVLWSCGHDHDRDALDSTTIMLGVRLGLDLLKHWSEQRKPVASLLVSEPFLRIHEEWLEGRPNSPPPSVNICLAKTEEAFEPVAFEGSGQKALVVDSDIDLSGTEVFYVEGYDDPDEDEIFGAWLIRVVQGN